MSVSGDKKPQADHSISLGEQIGVSISKKEDVTMYFIMLIYGISLLFSWTALLLSYHYFTNRLSGWKNNIYILDYLLLIFFFIRLISLSITPYFLKRVGQFALIRVSQTGVFICFLIFGFVAMFGDSLPNWGFLIIVIILVLLSAIFSVIAYQSGLSILTQIHPKYTQALSAGQGSAIVVSSIMKLVSVIITGNTGGAGNSSVVYFWMTSACSLAALISFIPVKGMISRWNSNRRHDIVDTHKIERTISVSLDSDTEMEREKLSNSDVQSEVPQSTFQSYLFVYKKIPHDFWIMSAITGQYIFVLPAFVNPIRSTKFSDYGQADSLYSVQIFTIFLSLVMGLGDFIGRMSLRWEKTHIQHRMLHPSLIIFRLLLMPFILLGNLYFGNDDLPYTVPRIFANDITTPIILALFGISGGYSITHWLMFSPRKLDDSQQRKKASFLGVLFMTFGMLCGTLLALIYKMLVLEWTTQIRS